MRAFPLSSISDKSSPQNVAQLKLENISRPSKVRDIRNPQAVYGFQQELIIIIIIIIIYLFETTTVHMTLLN